MSRAPIVVVIVVLLAANCVVFGNIAALLYTASSEAAGRINPTRTPDATATIQPAQRVQPPTASPSSTPAPSSTPTEAPSPVPTAVGTRALSSYPTYAPVGTGTPMKYPFVYTVKAGDTISGLANQFRISSAKLLAANGLTDSNLIRVGQTLLVPDPSQ